MKGTCHIQPRDSVHVFLVLVFVKLAELSMKTGKPRERKANSESSLRTFGTQGTAHALQEIVYGLTDILGERDQAISLLDI